MNNVAAAYGSNRAKINDLGIFCNWCQTLPTATLNALWIKSLYDIMKQHHSITASIHLDSAAQSIKSFFNPCNEINRHKTMGRISSQYFNLYIDTLEYEQNLYVCSKFLYVVI